MQTMTADNAKLQRKIRLTAILLGLVAFGFFVAFIAVTALRG